MKILITGMSGTGKSAVAQALAARVYRAHDLDDDRWSHWAPCEGNPTGAKPGFDWLWNEPAVAALLAEETGETLFLAGCASNMGRFVPNFDRIVLLSGPVKLLLRRVRMRDSNAYGKTADEAAQIANNLAEFEPRLRAISTDEVNVDQPFCRVLETVLRIAIS